MKGKAICDEESVGQMHAGTAPEAHKSGFEEHDDTDYKETVFTSEDIVEFTKRFIEEHRELMDRLANS